MTDRYPGYDVLAKRRTPSWNEPTRQVVNRRLAVPREPRYLTPPLFTVLDAVCQRILPQPTDRPPVPLAALVDDKLFTGLQDGFRYARMPDQGEAWRRGLAGLEEAAEAHYRLCFVKLSGEQQDDILRRMERGELSGGALGDMPATLFFEHRLILDIVTVYYAHPTAWSEMGYGGPASPRGYVRMGLDRRDPWEAAEAHDGDETKARLENGFVG
ncbi:gluconate 2-dehydrogenase subunit 3 family protein [Acidisoma silvae]|uniref:Gluconate 2-dehydrogenase subunit 3 family protein n=1 Tax=Acidisoma silvae TaxID=2802396 RepID=A0A963YWL7_9PROT|nr:gluconate 2-dehydrogenase subunit 3 family protein [Acidisoma silvae]MCB8878336.1 gluconate 2-dehydrogenase subunit 3 family protein [Acidisoma silvae]